MKTDGSVPGERYYHRGQHERPLTSFIFPSLTTKCYNDAESASTSLVSESSKFDQTPPPQKKKKQQLIAGCSTSTSQFDLSKLFQLTRFLPIARQQHRKTSDHFNQGRWPSSCGPTPRAATSSTPHPRMAWTTDCSAERLRGGGWGIWTDFTH